MAGDGPHSARDTPIPTRNCAAAAINLDGAIPAARATPARLDPDTWQSQLEELVAVQAVLDQDFSLLEAPGARRQMGGRGAGPSDARASARRLSRDSSGASDGGDGGGSGSGFEASEYVHNLLDPEALLMAGPPPELYGDADGAGSGGDAVDLFVAEALVHVEVPETGLQLMVEAPPPAPPPRQQEHEEESAAGPGASRSVGDRASGDGGRQHMVGAAQEGQQTAEATAMTTTMTTTTTLLGARPSSPASTASSSTPTTSLPSLAASASAPAAGANARAATGIAAAAPPAAAAELVPFGPRIPHLSPIRVTLTLPPGYPAACPPAVSLHAPWLSGPQAEALAAGLAGVWEAQGPGGPIALVWVDWLRGEALRHLAITDALVIRPVEEKAVSGQAAHAGLRGTTSTAVDGAAASTSHDGAAVAAAGDDDGASDVSDGGASSGSANAASDFADADAVVGGPAALLALSLHRYSARREQDVFASSSVRCPICFEEHLGSRCVRLPECRHAFCGGCLATHLRTQLRDGAVDRLACPEPGCRRQLAPYVLQQMLGQEEYERWERLSLQRVLDRMGDVVYCPRCRQACLEDPDHSVLCPSCFYSFCALCEESWHPGRECVDSEARLEAEQRRLALEDKRAARRAARAAVSASAALADRIQQLLNYKILNSTAKRCPNCGMGIEKNGGCNHMYCTNCNMSFQWDQAPQVRSLQEAYKKVVDKDSDEKSRRKAAKIRPVPCVSCGQPNVKEGRNNDVRCWACHGHFCYLCRAWLHNRPGQHFGTGPGRCHQHTDDGVLPATSTTAAAALAKPR
ncbi:hypothetical protein GPECTOR_25g313 [Gonium pectorale]|uniref:RBR-type E3 ubiquitin transferase n=1 Tax=Gonium pectorale TaxID=33097 RepID=A0A150GFW6_GONPE|nr:hypothetical protein GPECTOR_25g313 [Gonium pectorale]|eukprot:KXZ48729.1 hypothetical protein GPECTOR_25g313 [Gonium pectorale]